VSKDGEVPQIKAKGDGRNNIRENQHRSCGGEMKKKKKKTEHSESLYEAGH